MCLFGNGGAACQVAKAHQAHWGRREGVQEGSGSESHGSMLHGACLGKAAGMLCEGMLGIAKGMYKEGWGRAHNTGTMAQSCRSSEVYEYRIVQVTAGC